ncbi:MAG: hypothetical protein D6805_01220 [Planctomycetota bacterium]|nr:MAG: hypothetical protein D6805_01220 [Planctomycetota bacterium]
MSSESKVIIIVGGIFLIIIGVLGFFMFKIIRKKSLIEKDIAKFRRLNRDLRKKVNKKVRLELENRLNNLKKESLTFVEILPNLRPGEVDQFLADLSILRESANLKNLGYQSRETKSVEDVPQVISISYDLKMEGSFLNFVRFLSWLENSQPPLQNFVKVDAFKIKADSTDPFKQEKKINLRITSYYYAPEEKDINQLKKK